MGGRGCSRFGQVVWCSLRRGEENGYGKGIRTDGVVVLIGIIVCMVGRVDAISNLWCFESTFRDQMCLLELNAVDLKSVSAGRPTFSPVEQ